MPASIHHITAANTALLDNINPDVFDHAIDQRYLAAYVADPRHGLFVAVEAEFADFDRAAHRRLGNAAHLARRAECLHSADAQAEQSETGDFSHRSNSGGAQYQRRCF